MVTEKLANKRFAELQRLFASGKAGHAYLFLGPISPENKRGSGVSPKLCFAGGTG